MASGQGNYNQNHMKDLKSHSSSLFNQRLAYQYFLLDEEMYTMDLSYNHQTISHVKSRLKEIYRCIRPLFVNHPVMRVNLGMETKVQGIYITDIAMSVINNMFHTFMMDEEAEDMSEKFNYKRCYLIAKYLEAFDAMMRNALQYLNYFLVPNFKNRPDVDTAINHYKEMADHETVERLKQFVGDNHMIDFESFGSERIDFQAREGLEDDEEDEEDYDQEEDSDDEEDEYDPYDLKEDETDN